MPNSVHNQSTASSYLDPVPSNNKNNNPLMTNFKSIVRVLLVFILISVLAGVMVFVTQNSNNPSNLVEDTSETSAVEEYVIPEIPVGSAPFPDSNPSNGSPESIKSIDTSNLKEISGVAVVTSISEDPNEFTVVLNNQNYVLSFVRDSYLSVYTDYLERASVNGGVYIDENVNVLDFLSIDTKLSVSGYESEDLSSIIISTLYIIE